MSSAKGHLSPSGVWLADDFRDNLIIDRYDPVFADMRASKLKHLRSANSEDAVTWNVFRSLHQISPEAWLPAFWQRAFPLNVCPSDLNAVVRLWESVPPPLGLLAGGDEGHSEVDVVIEASSWVWFIEAKYRGDISLGTTTRPERDQILRNLDVGTYHAGVRQFFFSLLISSEEKSPEGAMRTHEYAKDLSIARTRLQTHRPDALQNLAGIGLLTWNAMADVLENASKAGLREDERAFAVCALAWLRERVLRRAAV